MSTTAGPNVPFRTGNSYLMPPIETDASSTQPSDRKCLALVIYPGPWKENPIHSAASKRGDKLRQQRPWGRTRVLRFQCRSRSESRQASLVMRCVLTLRMRISDWALETVCAAAAGISSEGRRRCNRLPNYKGGFGVLSRWQSPRGLVHSLEELSSRHSWAST